MTKLELIERIIDRITDPWTESCEDYRDAELIDLVTAGKIIDQCREEDNYNDPEDRLPAEVTPELMMIAYNCNVRKNRHELWTRALTELITECNMVCEYSEYYLPFHENAVDVLPIDFLWETDGSMFMTDRKETPDLVDIFRIGMNSAKTFSFDHEYCWFDSKNDILHSTNDPFKDGVISARDFAEYLLSDEGQDGLDYIINDAIDEETFQTYFKCSRKEFWAEF